MRDVLQFVGLVLAPLFTAVVLVSPFVPDFISRMRGDQ